jgi:TolB-like protein
MRRVFSALAVLLVFGLLATPAPAAADDGSSYRRPTVVILPVINNSGHKRTQYMADATAEALYAKFPYGRYLIVDGQTLNDALSRQGIDDIRAVDRATLNRALQAIGVDYSVQAEILSVDARQRVHFPDIFLLVKSWTAQVPVTVTVTNVRTGVAVYDAYFSEYAKHDFLIGFADKHQAISLALHRVLEKVAQEQINLE